MTMQCRRARARLAVTAIMVATATLIGHPALSQTLTFREAVDRASATAPSVDALEERTAGARRASVAADQLPDPKLNLGFSDLRLAQAERVPPFPNTYVRQTIGIRQDIPNLKKRHARSARSAANIVAAEADEAIAIRDVRVGAALAWKPLALIPQSSGPNRLCSTGTRCPSALHPSWNMFASSHWIPNQWSKRTPMQCSQQAGTMMPYSMPSLFAPCSIS